MRTIQDLEDKVNGCELSSSRHGLVTALTSLQQLWLITMDLHKTGPASNQSGMGKVHIWPYPLTAELFFLLIDSSKGVVIVFSCILISEPVFNGYHQIHHHTDGPG